jgi:hypothetical protein
VGLGEVDLGDSQVPVDHLEGGVAKDGLEGVDVSPIPQEVDGEGVAEAVGCSSGMPARLALAGYHGLLF